MPPDPNEVILPAGVLKPGMRVRIRAHGVIPSTLVTLSTPDTTEENDDPDAP